MATNNAIIKLLTRVFFDDCVNNFVTIGCSVIGFFLAVLLGYGLYECFLVYSFCHEDDKLNFPRNDYSFLLSCVRKKRNRSNTIMSYPSTRSGLDRLEAAKLDQEIRREKIRLGEPLHDDIRLTPVAKFKKIFTSKKSKIKNQKPVRVPEIDQPIPYEPIAAKPVKKVSKLIAFFSTKRSVDENKQPETFRAKSRIDRHFAELQNPTSVSTAKKIIRPKKPAKIHEPYSYLPTFAGPDFDSIPLQPWTVPNTNVQIAQAALDSGDVVMSISNDNFEASPWPASWPTSWPTSSFETFRPLPLLQPVEPKVVSSDSIGNSQPNQPDPDLIELAPDQPDPNLIELAPNQPDQQEQKTFF